MGPYIVENSGPSLHGDALEDGKDCKQDVVKLGDAIIRSDPGFCAGIFGWTLTNATRELVLRRVDRLIS